MSARVAARLSGNDPRRSSSKSPRSTPQPVTGVKVESGTPGPMKRKAQEDELEAKRVKVEPGVEEAEAAGEGGVVEAGVDRSTGRVEIPGEGIAAERAGGDKYDQETGTETQTEMQDDVAVNTSPQVEAIPTQDATLIPNETASVDVPPLPAPIPSETAPGDAPTIPAISTAEATQIVEGVETGQDEGDEAPELDVEFDPEPEVELDEAM